MIVDLVPGRQYDLVSPEEMRASHAAIAAKMQEYIRQEVVGIKPIRATSPITAYPANTIVLVSTPTPQSGYIWAVTRVTALGDANGTTSVWLSRTEEPKDVVSFNAARYVFAIVNNGIPQTFGKGQLLLNAGEHIVGSFFNSASAGNCMVSIEAIEVPAEMIGKLLM